MVAIAVRLIILPADPYLADDYQRYLFDGRLILSGINPYSATPAMHPDLGGPDIPKPEIGTIYPPLAEGIFAVAAGVGGTLFHWRLLMFIPEFLAAVAFLLLLKHHRLPAYWIVLWLWNPILLLEGVHSGHVDVWTAASLLWFVYLSEKKRYLTAALALSAAVLIKLIPLVLLPVWLSRVSQRNTQWQIIAIVVAAITFGFAWFAPYHPFGNILLFLQHIQGYGVLYTLLSAMFAVVKLDSEFAKLALVSFGAALLTYWVFVVGRYKQSSELALLEIFFVLFVVSSMGFPWYLLLSIPWLLMCRCWGLLVFAGLCHLIYYHQQLGSETTFLYAGAGCLLLILSLRGKVYETIK